MFLGKRIKCPTCGGSIKVSGMASPKKIDDDWLNLGSPAIEVESMAAPDAQEKKTHTWENRKKGTVAPPSLPKIEAPHAASPNTPSETKLSSSDPKTTPKVPKAPATTSAFQDPPGFEDPQPIEQRSAKVQPKKSVFDEDDLPALAPETPKQEAVWTRDLMELPHEPSASKPKARTPSPPKNHIGDWDDEPEFRVKCKVCGTMLYAKESQIGSKLQCSDCHSSVVVPPPPSDWNRKKQRASHRDLEKEDVSFAPLPGTPTRPESVVERNVAEVLAKAERELDEEEEDGMESAYDFDSKGWLGRTFSFLFDPGLMGIALGTGLVLACVLFAGGMFGALAERTQGASIILQILVWGGGGLPVLSVTLANGLAILQSSANRLKTVREWPLFNPADWMEESFSIILAFVFSTLPGAVLGSIAQNNNYPPIFTAACIIASVWLLLPIFLLSMLDNQNIFQPFSMDVFRSLSQKPEAWGGYYIISAIGAFCAWMMVTFALSNPSMGTIVAGMTLPLLMFFLFHQMGVLASVISEVTSLGFEAEAKPSNPE